MNSMGGLPAFEGRRPGSAEYTLVHTYHLLDDAKYVARLVLGALDEGLVGAASDGAARLDGLLVVCRQHARVVWEILRPGPDPRQN